MRKPDGGTCQPEVHHINDAADVIGAWIKAGADLPLWDSTAHAMAGRFITEARRELGSRKRAYNLTVTMSTSGLVTIVKHMCTDYACEEGR